MSTTFTWSDVHYKPLLHSSDNSILHMGLLNFWSLSIVSHAERTDYGEYSTVEKELYEQGLGFHY